MPRPLKIFLSAGEASGDRLGAGLARALRARRPDVELVGMGGDEMAEAGVRILQHASEVAVMGIVEVVRHLPALRRVMSKLEQAITREAPDLFVPIDFPDFNLRLAARARRAKVDIVYFVSPQVWAWRRGRVHRIRELVRRVLVLFPFEVEFYRDLDVPVTFVGHPAAEEFASAQVLPREALLERLSLETGKPLIGLLPGSRRGEVERHMPILLDAASLLRRARPDTQFVIPRARTIPEGLLESHVASSSLPGVRVHFGDYPAVLRACACAAIASGTATLDAALAELPMVVIYRVPSITYAIARMLVHLEQVSLPNLIAGKPVVPELIQGACTPERIAAELDRYLDGSQRAADVAASLAEVRKNLGPPGAFERAAEAVLAEAVR